MIVPGLTNSFKKEILSGVHQATDVYRAALYRKTAMLSEQTTVYQTEGEVIESLGYTAGGLVLTGLRTLLDGRVAIMTWSDLVWPNATITARAVLIYNYTRSNRAVAVVDLGKDFTSTNGDFKVDFPEATAKTAVIRIN